MMKMNFTNKQPAFEYAFLVIAESYFDKTCCKSEKLEQKLRQHYKEQRADWQCQMKELCTCFMDSMYQSLPERDFAQDMEVFLVRGDSGKQVHIIFANNHLIFEFICSYRGQRSRIRCKILKKKTTSQEENK